MEQHNYSENSGSPGSAFSMTEELKRRIVAGLVMSAVALVVVLVGGLPFIAIVLLATLQMMREWDRLTEHQGPQLQHLGLVYLALPAASLIWLRELSSVTYPYAGLQLTVYVLLVVWATDIGAYFAGKQLGGPKLAPEISPNKTWSGLLGGMAAAGGLGLVAASFTPYPTTVVGCVAMGMLLAVVSQAGDLFESWLKRRAGVKDSGTLIPGHGGLLDRVDGLLTAIPVFALFVALSRVMS